jgi:hypothetical protein
MKQEQVTPAELDTSVLDTGPAELDSAVSESTTFRWEFGKKNGEAGAGNGIAGGVGSIGSRSSRIGSLGHQELDAGSESLSLRTTRSPSQSQAKIENEKPIEERQDGGKDKSSDATGSAETNQQLPGPEQSSTTSQPAIDKDLFIFSDEMDAIPGFGRQFGIAPTSIIREQEAKEAENPEPEPEPEPRTEPEQTAEVKGKGKDFESFFQQVDEELEALYTDYLSLSGKQNAKPKFSWKPGFIGATSAKSYTKAATGEDACIICLEPFASSVLAPPTVTMACQHPPSVCYGCLAKSIKHDLETKFWDEIKCPECKVLFTHEDVKKFADEATFERYVSLRSTHRLKNTDKIGTTSCHSGTPSAQTKTSSGVSNATSASSTSQAPRSLRSAASTAPRSPALSTP